MDKERLCASAQLLAEHIAEVSATRNVEELNDHPMQLCRHPA